jgi:hypothetical protein
VRNRAIGKGVALGLLLSLTGCGSAPLAHFEGYTDLIDAVRPVLKCHIVLPDQWGEVFLDAPQSQSLDCRTTDGRAILGSWCSDRTRLLKYARKRVDPRYVAGDNWVFLAARASDRAHIEAALGRHGTRVLVGRLPDPASQSN